MCKIRNKICRWKASKGSISQLGSTVIKFKVAKTALFLSDGEYSPTRCFLNECPPFLALPAARGLRAEMRRYPLGELGGSLWERQRRQRPRRTSTITLATLKKKKANYPTNKSALYFHLTQLVINCVSEFWIDTGAHSLLIIHSLVYVSHSDFQSKHIFSAGVCVNHPTHTFHGLVFHNAWNVN